MITSLPSLSRPTTIAAAVELLAAQGAVALAGGTDLMNGIRLGRAAPTHVVDLAAIAELQRLELADEVLTIGAGVTMRRLLGDPAVVAAVPAVADAAALLGGRQIQASATFGGNLCNGSPAAETAPPLLALGARAHIAGVHGERQLPLAELWAGPGRTTLAPGELLVALTVPRRPDAVPAAYRRLELRRSVDIALVSAAAWIAVTDGEVSDARIAIGAAAPTPRLVVDAAASLVGTPIAEPTAAVFGVVSGVPSAWDLAVERAATAVAAASAPITDHRATAGYRRAMVAAVTRRALAGARARAVGLGTGPAH